MGQGKSEKENERRIKQCINGGKCEDVYLGGEHYRKKYGLTASALPSGTDKTSMKIESMFAQL